MSAVRCHRLLDQRARQTAIDPELPAMVFATADRCTLKDDIGRHPGAATKFRELSFGAARRRLNSGAGRTTAAQGLELALPTQR